jgi:hypothetical protein
MVGIWQGPRVVQSGLHTCQFRNKLLTKSPQNGARRHCCLAEMRVPPHPLRASLAGDIQHLCQANPGSREVTYERCAKSRSE